MLIRTRASTNRLNPLMDPNNLPRLRIWQQNLNKSLTAQQAFLHSLKGNCDVVCIQEPHFDFRHISRALPNWIPVYPVRHLDNPDKTRSLILVSKSISTNSWSQLEVLSPDITAIQINNPHQKVRVFNVYNDCTHSHSIHALRTYLNRAAARRPEARSIHDIWLGDFNRHHPLWDEERNSHLFTRANLDAAEEILELMAEFGMEMILPKDIPTLRALNTQNLTRPDNVFCSADLVELVVSCNTSPGDMPPCTDHFPIRTTFDLGLSGAAHAPKRNFRATNWVEFVTTLEAKLALIPAPTRLTSEGAFREALANLTNAIQEAISERVPLSRPSPHAKRWWSKELEQARGLAKRLGRTSHKFALQAHHPAHEAFRRARNDYSQLIKKTKRDFWEDWLEQVDAESVWAAHRFVSAPGSDGGRARIPALKMRTADGRLSEVHDNEEKSKLFHEAFFYAPPADPGVDPDYQYPPPKFRFKHVSDAQIDRAIRRLNPYKAPGMSGISNSVLTHARSLLVPFLGPIFRATFSLHIYPEEWRNFTTAVLRKHGKTDYTVAKAYRPIALLDVIAKVLSSCVKETLLFFAEKLGLLADTQFGSRAGRTTTDSIHLVVNFVKDAWRRGDEVAGLFLDIKGAFPNTVVARLLHDMRMAGVPKQYTDWIARKMEGRKTVIAFDDYVSELFEVRNGLDQGCNLSGAEYAFYNRSQVTGSDGCRGESASSFVDDTINLAAGKDLTEATRRIEDMMLRPGGGIQWAETHFSQYEYDKFGLVGFSRRRVQDPNDPQKRIPVPRPSLRLGGHTIHPSPSHTFLGVILDQELRFKEHANHALAKGMNWVSQIRRLAKTNRGIGGTFSRRLYLGVAVPSMLYAADVWCTPAAGASKRSRGSSGFITKLERVQRAAALQITGGLRTSPTDLLDVHADLLPLRLFIKKLCHRAALRIACLPKTHPLYKPARHTHRHFVKRHRGPLHNIMHTLQVPPDKIETIATVRREPTWASSISSQIAASKDLAEQAELCNEADIKVYSDGSGFEGGIGAAAILYRGFHRPKSLSYHLGPIFEHTVFEGECVGILLAMELIRRENDVGSTSLGVDNQAAIETLMSNAPMPSHYIVDQIHDAYRGLKLRHARIALCVNWVPGHRGIPGSEIVDGLAKRAAGGYSSPAPSLPVFLRKSLPASKSALKQAYAQHTKKLAIRMFRKSPRFAKISLIDASLPSSKYRRMASRLPRRHASLLFQLRCGHVPLNKYLHRIKRVDSPTCSACNQYEETISHFLLHCPAYSVPRLQMRNALSGGALTIARLLSQKSLPHLFQFIQATARFSDILGDLTLAPHA